MSLLLALPAMQGLVIALPLALGAGLVGVLVLAWPRRSKRSPKR